MDITRVDEVTCDEGFITLRDIVEDCPGVILLEEHEDVVVVFIMNLSTAIRTINIVLRSEGMRATHIKPRRR